jgi:AcrR family transcriptional regulator
MASKTDRTGSPDGSPAEETRQRILRAAAALFAERGYAGATTRAIAAAAGVNEVTIFRHFGNKKSLLLAVIGRDAPLPRLQAALAGQLEGDYRGALLKLGTIFAQTMLEQRRAVLMSLCAAEQLPEVREAVSQAPAQQRRLLGDYFRRQIEQGVMRDVDPGIAAQAFLGLFFAFSISQGLLGADPAADLPLEVVVEQFVDIFVRGTAQE